MGHTLDRTVILDEARRLFARRGFAKTSLNDIVSRLGVGKTAIYHHFPGGKGEIVDACLRRDEEALFESMRSAVERNSDPRERLRAMVLAKMAGLGQLRDRLGISPVVGRELIQLYQQHRRRFNEFEELLLKSIICRGQAERVADPALPAAPAAFQRVRGAAAEEHHLPRSGGTGVPPHRPRSARSRPPRQPPAPRAAAGVRDGAGSAGRARRPDPRPHLQRHRPARSPTTASLGAHGGDQRAACCLR
jgi:AcrR family transcriptional regulator